MISADLKDKGFDSWQQFNKAVEHQLLESAPPKYGAYVLRKTTPFGRFVGHSDICYVGSAANKGGLKKRLYQYFHPGPTQTTNHRILNLVCGSTDFEISFVQYVTVESALDLERSILQRYLNEHFELPPLNRQI